ncbi:MAG: hypothetical protein H6831_10105 [Planctomycetes bacterium]|nr:hypothetical protein [Planctomycetota bacterium]MCB9904747.1 hypothetical protein [Planctomycetota bacterium]
MSAEAGWMEALGEGPEREKAVGGLTGLLFWTGGLAATGLGVALALGDRIAPEVGWIGSQFARSGVNAGPVIACGTLALGFAWISRIQRHHGAMVARTLDQGLMLSKLTQDLSGLRENIARVQLEFAQVQQTNRTLLNLSREQAAAAAASEPTKDAMFRLAASMDQLGARLETRVRTQFDSLEKRVADFDRRLEETSMVQRSELAKLEERLAIAATLAQPAQRELPYVEGAPTNDVQAQDHAPPTDEDAANDEPVVELQPRDEWLEITVELEEEDYDVEFESDPPGLFDSAESTDSNDNWFEEATRNAGMDTGEDLLDAGEPTRLSPAAAPDETDETDEMLEQLDSLFNEQESVAEVLENLRRRRGE